MKKAPNFAARSFVSTSDVRCDGPCCFINKVGFVVEGASLLKSYYQPTLESTSI